MATYEKTGTAEAGFVSSVVPEAVAALSEVALGTRAEVEAEIDHMLHYTRQLWSMEPDEVMKVCAAYSARCTELYVHLHRVEGRAREWRQVRTQQVDRLIQELDRQFKLASRSIEVRRQDLELGRGY